MSAPYARPGGGISQDSTASQEPVNAQHHAAAPNIPGGASRARELRGASALSELNGCDALRDIDIGDRETPVTDDAAIRTSVVDFLTKNKAGRRAVLSVLRSRDLEKPQGVRVSWLDLMQSDPVVAHLLLFTPRRVLAQFDRTLVEVQNKIKRLRIEQCRAAQDERKVQEAQEWRIKKDSRTRIHTLPYFGGHFFLDRIPNETHLNKLIEFQGTVTRSTAPKTVLELAKYKCSACSHLFLVRADFEQMNSFPKITKCPNPSDECTAFAGFEQVEELEYVDYQEVKLQEHVAKVGSGTLPKSAIAVLRHSLVDSLKPGDDCRITAIPTRRWRILPNRDEQQYDVELVLDAVDVQVINKHKWAVDLSDESTAEFRKFWEQHKFTPMTGRNKIIASVCPKLFGMAAVKLALLLCVIGGVKKGGAEGHKVRGESHMLMIGEPGCGKSQCLKFAALLGARSVMTTGGGTTKAGLTVACVKEPGSGDFVLEAGALVLANDGICCIDEFTAMSNKDRASIHEAMEQQSISVAKGGINTSLPSRTTVIAASNPKGEYDIDISLDVNTNIASPLLSRFDVIMILADLRRHVDQAAEAANLDPFNISRGHADGETLGWDTLVCQQILHSHMVDEDDAVNSLWDLDQLRGYVAYCKQFKPRMTDASSAILGAYFKYQRSVNPANQARITTRLLESLVRLSEAHAKLMRHVEVEVMDAISAILVCEVSMSGTSLLLQGNDPLTPRISPMFGGDALHSSFALDPDREYTRLERMVLERLRLDPAQIVPPPVVNSFTNSMRPLAGNPFPQSSSLFSSADTPSRQPFGSTHQVPQHGTTALLSHAQQQSRGAPFQHSQQVQQPRQAVPPFQPSHQVQQSRPPVQQVQAPAHQPRVHERADDAYGRGIQAPPESQPWVQERRSVEDAWPEFDELHFEEAIQHAVSSARAQQPQVEETRLEEANRAHIHVNAASRSSPRTVTGMTPPDLPALSSRTGSPSPKSNDSTDYIRADFFNSDPALSGSSTVDTFNDGGDDDDLFSGFRLGNQELAANSASSAASKRRRVGFL